jgi:hypothetical protein
VAWPLPILTAMIVSALSLGQAGAPKPIELRVPAHECAAPCDMQVTVLIPAHPDNRSAAVVWSYSGSADLHLGPNNPQVEFAVAVGGFEKGDHMIYAVLMRERDGHQETFQDFQRVSVR